MFPWVIFAKNEIWFASEQVQRDFFSTNFNLQSDWQLDNVLCVDFKHLGEFDYEDMQEILKLTLWMQCTYILEELMTR